MSEEQGFQRFLSNNREWLYNANGEGFWAVKDWIFSAYAKVVNDKIDTLTSRNAALEAELTECAERLEFLSRHLRGRMGEGALADIATTAENAREVLSK